MFDKYKPTQVIHLAALGVYDGNQTWGVSHLPPSRWSIQEHEIQSE